MDESITVFLFVLTFIAIFLIVVISSSLIRNIKTRNFLKSLDLSTFKKIEIIYMQSSSTKARVIGGNDVKANLYLNSEFFVITHKENSCFNSIYNRMFPIVITNDFRKTSNIMYSPRIIVPKKLSITSWNAINIDFDEDRFLNIKYKITIRLKNKKDIEHFEELNINNWF